MHSLHFLRSVAGLKQAVTNLSSQELQKDRQKDSHECRWKDQGHEVLEE